MQNIFHVPFRMLLFGTILLTQQQLTLIAYPVVEIHFLEMPFFYLVQLFGQLLLADCARLSGKNGNSNTCVYYLYYIILYYIILYYIILYYIILYYIILYYIILYMLYIPLTAINSSSQLVVFFPWKVSDSGDSITL